MSDKYILNGKTPVLEPDLMKWGNWFGEGDSSRVAKDEKDGVKVSTVFLGMDHGIQGDDPILFETMIFGGEHDGDMERYCTWEEAEKGHKEFVKKFL